MHREYGYVMLQFPNTDANAKKTKPESTNTTTTGLLDFFTPLMFWKQPNSGNTKTLNKDLSTPLISPSADSSAVMIKVSSRPL